MIRVVGSYASPYVRRVLVTLALKGQAYEIDPIVPFYGDARFAAANPLRRVPVLIHDGLTLADSAVICEYLEEAFPTPALLPISAADRARARWLVEFAGARMGQVIVWKLFNQRVINRGVWGRKPDEAVVAEALEQDLPAIMDWLETEAPADAFRFGTAPGLADISIGAFLRNAAMAGWTPDPARWPLTAAWAARLHALPAFADLVAFETITIRTPIADHRAALAAAGAPVSVDSWGTPTPVKGPLSV